MQAGSTFTLDTLVRVDWEVTLGDEKLSRQELEALAKLKAPLVRLRGQWVHISREEIEAALAFWKRQGEAKTTVRDVVQMALGSVSTPGGMAFDGVEAGGWVGALLAQPGRPSVAIECKWSADAVDLANLRSFRHR